MAKKLLITGRPGAGKTTLIKKVARMLQPFHPVGFYTEEIRAQGQRVGFQLVSLDGQRRIMSHVDIPSPFRVGSLEWMSKGSSDSWIRFPSRIRQRAMS